jgi:hypothetical protein
MGQQHWWMEKKNRTRTHHGDHGRSAMLQRDLCGQQPQATPVHLQINVWKEVQINQSVGLYMGQKVVAERGPHQETPCTVGVGGGTGGNDFVGRKQGPPPLVAAFFVLHHFQLGVQITFRPVFFPNFLRHVWRCRRLLLSTSTRTRQRL